MKTQLVFSTCFFILPGILAGQAVSPVPNLPATAGSESLGNQLLDDLPVTIPPRNPQSGAEGTPRTDKTSSPSAAPVDDIGEDIGRSSGPLGLTRVRNDMRQAEMLLGRPATETNTGPLKQAGEVQKRVVAQLDELIAELCKQCQGGQGQSSSSPSTSQQSQRSAAKAGQPKPTATAGKSPARDSSDPLNRADAQTVDNADVDELAKHLWGHLPERNREQVLQSFSDEFLPKYEMEIEQYYRRLSEERDENLPR